MRSIFPTIHGTILAVRRTLIAIGMLALAACVPLPAPVTDDDASSLSIDTETGSLDITPEPFEDPLAPATLTGAVAIAERTSSGVLLEIGNVRARTTMTVFLNVESPYAREFQRSRMPLLIQEFVEPGALKIRIVILPIAKYAGSDESTRTIGCAAAQAKGYPTLELLTQEERTTLTQDDVTELALDALLFLSCMQTGQSDLLTIGAREAARWNVTLVPTYVIDEEVFTGLPTEADLRGQIHAAF